MLTLHVFIVMLLFKLWCNFVVRLFALFLTTTRDTQTFFFKQYMMDFAVVLQRIFVGTKYKVRTNWCDKSITADLERFNF